MPPRTIKQTRIYDKHRPEGRQEVALLIACKADGGEPQILFTGQQYEGGVCFLNKQHAVEFASCMLMMALGLPGISPLGIAASPKTSPAAPRRAEMATTDISHVKGGVLVAWGHACGHLGNTMFYDSAEKAEAVRASMEARACWECLESMRLPLARR